MEADKWSCSLINHQHQGLFNQNGGGILNPRALGVGKNGGVACAFAGDGGTSSKPMGGCADPHWPNCVPPRVWQCHWPADNLKGMLEHSGNDRYNEVVVSRDYLDAHLPQVVDAILLPIGGEGNPKSQSRTAYGQLRKAHPRWVAPLVRFSGGRFSLAG